MLHGRGGLNRSWLNSEGVPRRAGPPFSEEELEQLQTRLELSSADLSTVIEACSFFLEVPPSLSGGGTLPRACGRNDGPSNAGPLVILPGEGQPLWRQPKGKTMASFVNSHTNATSKR